MFESENAHKKHQHTKARLRKSYTLSKNIETNGRSGSLPLAATVAHWQAEISKSEITTGGTKTTLFTECPFLSHIETSIPLLEEKGRNEGRKNAIIPTCNTDNSANVVIVLESRAQCVCVSTQHGQAVC
jgi:hypothetical protein